MEINEYLVRFLEIVRDIEGLDLFSYSSKLSNTEFRMIREIILEGEKGRGIISSELARRLGVTRSAISQEVNKLEARGVVKRVASLTDKKIAYIELSEASVAVFEEQCQKANEMFEKLVSEYGEEKMKTFFDSCTELSAAFRKVYETNRKDSKAEE